MKLGTIKSGCVPCLLCLLLTLNGLLESNGQSFTSSFTSLSLPVSAELSGLGGVNVSRTDYKVNFFQNNPALVSDTLNGWASANHLFYFSNIGLTNFAYQQEFKRVGSVSFGVSHLNLGILQGYDILGNPTSMYSSGETTLMIGKSHQVNWFRFGVNVKGVFSNLAGYRASALLIDLGGAFVHPDKDLSIGLAIKNLGFVTQEFSSTSSSGLPFDVQTGVSYKPQYMPVRISATAYHLTDFKIPLTDLNSNEKSTTLDKVASHLTFGAEVLLHQNINILLGYNFLKHKELKLETAGGGSGFSVGALLKLKHLNFAFSRSGYVTGGAYQVSLNMNTNKILRRK